MVAKGFRSVKGPAAPPYTSGPYTFSESINLMKEGLPYERYTLTEMFEQLPQLNASIGVATNLDFEILGTNASNDDVTFSSTVAGIQLQTDGAANDQVIVLPHLDTSQSAWAGVKWGTENQVIWECVLRTSTSVSAVVIYAGLKLTNTPVVATDNDQVFFRYDGNVANWEATVSIGGTDLEIDTGVPVTADTNYYLKIEIDSLRQAHFYINNNEVYVSSALTNDVDLIPYVGISASTAAAKEIVLCMQRISRIIFE